MGRPRGQTTEEQMIRTHKHGKTGRSVQMTFTVQQGEDDTRPPKMGIERGDRFRSGHDKAVEEEKDILLHLPYMYCKLRVLFIFLV